MSNKNKPAPVASKPAPTSKGKPAPTSKPARKGKPAPPVAPPLHANGAEFSAERPGVLAFFVGELLRAHPTGVSKRELLALACKAFPKRDESKLKSTIAMQLPSGFYIEKRYVLTRIIGADGAKRFSLSPAAKAAGDAWRVMKRTDPKGAARIEPKRPAPTNDSDE